ncbi:MAG: T9SS type A sorting domain-containing protein [Flavobacteriales bacterium]|nr:T9SS type A sorting domain-containing protein [Flavobacteriales bacterium]
MEASLGDLVVSTAVSPSFMATQGFQQTHPDITTSLPEEHPPDIDVFPNPTRDRLTILLPELHVGVAQFALFDASGRSVPMVAQRMDDRFLIDLSALSSGNYFLRIVRDLEPPTTIKIVKQE